MDCATTPELPKRGSMGAKLKNGMIVKELDP
jgi:hypothetical protein